MILKSFGCSFVYGSELADVAGLNPGTNPPASRLTWPALLAAQQGYEYQSWARPGVGNLYILESILNQASSVEPQLFVICWTWIDRFDFVGSGDQWQTLTPGCDSDLANHYYRNLHSQYRDKFTTLCAIKLTIDTLKQQGHPFIMTAMDDLIMEADYHTSPAVIDLQDFVRPHITWFGNQTFLEWSKSNQFPISPLLHPGAEAHSAAAELVLPKVRALCT